jgi:hypothetical protein
VGTGLAGTYQDLVEAAFREKFWDSDAIVDADGNVIAPLGGGGGGQDQFTVAEFNFSLFWGVSVGFYMSTLVSDDARYDRFARGEIALTDEELLGLDVFLNEGNCTECHQGAEFTNASSQNGGNGNAFVNTGVRAIAMDPGQGEGEFKSSSLRNVELTGPYFHTGQYLTLRQVVDFYDRGGDVNNDQNELEPLNLTEAEKDALVAFLMTLTDDRVRTSSPPFDHPSLTPPNGPNVSATGTLGGAPIGTFLGANPFDADPNDIGIVVCEGSAGCPCGNDSPFGSGRGCQTTEGSGIRIRGSGSTSVAANDLTVTARRVPPGNTGIFYAGDTQIGPNALFDGLQCAGGFTIRFQGQLAGLDGIVSDTDFVNQDPVGVLFFVPGRTVLFQYFSRDNQAGPSPCGGGANLSAVLQVTLTP